MLNYNLLNYQGKRPNGSYEHLKAELVDYVKQEIKKNHYPSRRELEQKFRLILTNLFDGIDDLYSKAGSRYVQKNSQELKSKKAKLLLKIVVSILPRFNLLPLKICGVHEQGIDILALDEENELNEIIGIEIKAFNKYEMIKKRNIEQIKRMLQKRQIKNGMLFTSASKIQTNIQLPSNVKIFLYENLIKFCTEEQFEILDFIRNFSIHKEIHENKIKRRRIIQYAKEKYNQNIDISWRDIRKDLNLDVRTYFKNIYQVYESARIPIPLAKIRGFKNSKKEHPETQRAKEEFIKRILNFIETEVNKGHYPSGDDIEKFFGISHIWGRINMSDLYRMLNLPTYLERKKLGLHSFC